jgi:hypothetical protein
MPTMYRPPDFQPLERALAARFGETASAVMPAFWFIGFVAGPDDVGELRLYEHSQTHGRLALDRHGRAFCWYAEIGAFGRMTTDDAWIEALLEPIAA